MNGPMLVICLLLAWMTFVGWLFLKATVRPAAPAVLPHEDAPPTAEPLWVSERSWRAYVESGISALGSHLRDAGPAAQ
jgi:hypothetical protein